jgi:hypothetical protein
MLASGKPGIDTNKHEADVSLERFGNGIVKMLQLPIWSTLAAVEKRMHK